MKCETWLWLAPALLLTAASAVAETGYTLRAIDLKAKPFLDSDTVAKLPDKAELEIVVRQGPWMQVKTKDQKTGYVRLLQVRLGAAVTAKEPGGYVPIPATGPGTSSRPTTTATVTTGVRGFSEEDLKASQPNKAEYEKMKGFAATPDQAAAYAASVTLAARTVPYYGEDGKALKDKGSKK
jgi:hypothetical protein